MENYCFKCGKKCIDVELDTWNTETGEKNTKRVCPSGICDHTGCEHRFSLKNVCLICGETVYNFGY